MARRIAIHVGLFVACCATTSLLVDPVFGATLMAILTCHELGHYLAARIRRVPASLPYFIPLPFGFGTMGAVISMDQPIRDRDALFDVGAAGPIAGLVVAIPLLVIGLAHSPIAPVHVGDSLEGNSILYAVLKYIVFGRWLPSGGMDVQLGSMADAAWVGIFVTMVNLMPIGQLDGGHVARVVLGNRHEALSRRLHVLLPIIGAIAAAVMFVQARADGLGTVDALQYAKYGAIPWLVWTAMLAVIRSRSGEYHPAVSDEPLTPLRAKLAWGMLIVFILIATPVPFRPVLP